MANSHGQEWEVEIQLLGNSIGVVYNGLIKIV